MRNVGLSISLDSRLATAGLPQLRVAMGTTAQLQKKEPACERRVRCIATKLTQFMPIIACKKVQNR